MNFPQIFQTFFSSISAIFIQVPPPSPETASIDIESQPVWPPSQPQLHSQLEASLDVQNHQQWKSGVVAFCFSYALGVSLQFASPDQTDHRLPFPMVLLSFLVLLTFVSTLVAPVVHPKCPMISQALQKVALVLAAAAFCHTLSIPFSIELKCAVWALFFLSLLLAVIFTYLNVKKA
ncbi:hypothetical protein V6N13_039451 [Hibiscus sabdariffa]